MKAIAYSIFGYDRILNNSWAEYETYIRGFFVNVRMNRVLYPNWQTVLNIDAQSYSPHRKIYDWLQNKGFIVMNICPDDELLCRAMLWRMKTVFAYLHPEWIYSHVLCRDTDSVPTYREAQAVKQWIDENKAAHCITDSISHNIPMMGGMIGFKPADLSSRMGVNTWDDLMKLGAGMDFKIKGSDQTFLNKYVYEKVSESATEHFVLGMRHNLHEGDGRHYSIPDGKDGRIDYKIDVDPVYKCTNDCCGHIGSAGFYEPPTIRFLTQVDPYRDEYAQIERQFPKLFFWRG